MPSVILNPTVMGNNNNENSFPSEQINKDSNIGGSYLSHTAVKLDSHLALIFCQINFINSLDMV